MVAAGTILALVILFRSTELVSLYRCRSQKVKTLSVRTNHIALMVNIKITGTVRIIPVLAVLGFLFVHGNFHILFHIVKLTVQIIIKASIAGIHGLW
jgi:hypothetical protein